VRGGIDPGYRAGYEDLGPEAPSLLQRPARQLVARDARREPKVVLDPRGGAGLPPRRFTLDHDRPEPLRRSINGRGEPGSTGTDDHDVVLGIDGLRREAEQFRDAPQLWPHDGLAVDDADRGMVLTLRQRLAPLSLRIRVVGRNPSEADLVAIQELAYHRAAWI